MATFIEKLYAAEQRHAAEALRARALLREWARPGQLPRIPGCDTVLRLAWAIECRSCGAEEAAGREWLYRWHLAIDNLAIHTDGTHPGLAVAYAPDLLGM